MTAARTAFINCGESKMKDEKVSPSLQDFSLVRTHVQQYTSDYELDNDALGFMFFALDMILGLQDDDAEDAITDTSYLVHSKKAAGHDWGIDVVFLEYVEKTVGFHLFHIKI